MFTILTVYYNTMIRMYVSQIPFSLSHHSMLIRLDCISLTMQLNTLPKRVLPTGESRIKILPVKCIKHHPHG